MIGLGLITFGGGIVLIAQMFHLQAYDVTSWLVWGSVGLLLTYLYRSRYLYLIGDTIYVVLTPDYKSEKGIFEVVAAYDHKPSVQADEVILKGHADYSYDEMIYIKYGTILESF